VEFLSIAPKLRSQRFFFVFFFFFFFSVEANERTMLAISAFPSLAVFVQIKLSRPVLQLFSSSPTTDPDDRAFREPTGVTRVYVKSRLIYSTASSRLRSFGRGLAEGNELWTLRFYFFRFLYSIVAEHTCSLASRFDRVVDSISESRNV